VLRRFRILTTARRLRNAVAAIVVTAAFADVVKLICFHMHHVAVICRVQARRMLAVETHRTPASKAGKDHSRPKVGLLSVVDNNSATADSLRQRLPEHHQRTLMPQLLPPDSCSDAESSRFLTYISCDRAARPTTLSETERTLAETDGGGTKLSALCPPAHPATVASTSSVLRTCAYCRARAMRMASSGETR
jgi:hypothetical protein